MKKQTCPHCHQQFPIQKTSFCPICGLSLKNQLVSLRHIEEKKYASLGARLLARLIDYVIIGIVTLIIDWNTKGALLEGLEWFGYGLFGISQVTYALWISIVLLIGYFAIFQSFSGQTPGKWLCQIMILKQGEQIPSVAANIFRELGFLITLITGGWLLLVLFLSERNKGFHDFLAGVEVYRVTPL